MEVGDCVWFKGNVCSMSPLWQCGGGGGGGSGGTYLLQNQQPAFLCILCSGSAASLRPCVFISIWPFAQIHALRLAPPRLHLAFELKIFSSSQAYCAVPFNGVRGRHSNRPLPPPKTPASEVPETPCPLLIGCIQWGGGLGG